MSDICAKIHHFFTDLPKFGYPFDVCNIPRNGVYILFEKGEYAHQVDRIVRVGTHTGNGMLPSRLQQHFVRENKDRSIFRKNIGRALLNKDHDKYIFQWEIDLTGVDARKKYSDKIDMARLKEMEERVSLFIRRNFHFVVFREDDKAIRLVWEAKIISTISQCSECCPSENWLGSHSPKKKIRESGLWLVNELCGQPIMESDYEKLKSYTTSKEQ